MSKAIAYAEARAAGGCHCGAVRFAISVEQDSEMLDCNCSICSMSGYLHLFVLHKNFELLSGDDTLSTYRFGSGEAAHIFCQKCGIKSYYQPRSHPECYSVNYHCLDAGHDIRASITPFDGRNWEKAASKKGLG